MKWTNEKPAVALQCDSYFEAEKINWSVSEKKKKSQSESNAMYRNERKADYLHIDFSNIYQTFNI